MEFVDRKEELDHLEREFRRSEASFVVIYGRRRIGKTRLIREFIKRKKHVYFLAIQTSDDENRKLFQETAYFSLKAPSLDPSNDLSWKGIFWEISRNSLKKRLVVVIDEFQYLVKGNPAFPSMLQAFWDEFLSSSNIILILCGSLVGMMYEHVLSYSSPLYGRRTSQIKLSPIPFKHFREFAKELDEKDLISFYAVTGGVPKYIETLDFSKNIFWNIQENIMNPRSYLYEEPYFLLSNEVKEIGSYFTILRSIAMGKRRSSQIAAELGVKQTSLGYYLKVLSDLDLIEKRVPVFEKNPQKSKKGLYFIRDHFIDFWFKFVYPFRSYIEIGNTEIVMNHVRKHFIEKHESFVYENLCRQIVFELALDGRLPFEIDKLGSHWEKDLEIDIVGLKDGKVVVIGECKDSEKKVGIDVYKQLLMKATKLPTDGAPYFLICSKSGFDEELINLSKKDRLILIEGLKLLE